MPRSAAAVARYERERAARQEELRQLLELRKSGKTYREIAEIQNCSIARVTRRLKKAIAQLVPQELVDSVRTLELDRYDTITQMNLALLVRAYQAGDVETFCKVQDRINAVHDRRKKMVPVEVPTRVVIDQTVEVQTDQDRELADLLRSATQDVEDRINQLREEKFS